MNRSLKRLAARLPLRAMLIAGAALLVVLVVVVYFVFDPASSALFPKCGFLMLTGYKCPGCGMQRMVHALLHGDVVAAFRYNAYLMLVLPLVAVVLVLECLRNRVPRLYARLPFNAIAVGYLVLTLVWMVVRNVFGV